VRPYWKGNLKLALVSCPVALHAACSTSERVAFRQINKATVNRLRQQLVDEETVIEIDRFVPRPRIDQRFQRVEQFAAGQEQLAAGHACLAPKVLCPSDSDRLIAQVRAKSGSSARTRKPSPRNATARQRGIADPTWKGGNEPWRKRNVWTR